MRTIAVLVLALTLVACAHETTKAQKTEAAKSAAAIILGTIAAEADAMAPDLGARAQCASIETESRTTRSVVCP